MSIRVVVYSSDFRLAYNVQEALVGTGLTFEHINDPDAKIVADLVVQSSKDELKTTLPRIFLHSQSSVSQIRSKIYQALDNVGGTLVVGVDPGKTIGVCTILGDKIIRTTVVNSPNDLVNWLRKEFSQITHNSLLIRIGNGGGKYQEDVVDLILKSFHKSARIEIVDETNTSKKINGRSKHEIAAISIAMRKKQ